MVDDGVIVGVSSIGVADDGTDVSVGGGLVGSGNVVDVGSHPISAISNRGITNKVLDNVEFTGT